MSHNQLIVQDHQEVFCAQELNLNSKDGSLKITLTRNVYSGFMSQIKISAALVLVLVVQHKVYLIPTNEQDCEKLKDTIADQLRKHPVLQIETLTRYVSSYTDDIDGIYKEHMVTASSYARVIVQTTVGTRFHFNPDPDQKNNGSGKYTPRESVLTPNDENAPPLSEIAKSNLNVNCLRFFKVVEANITQGGQLVYFTHDDDQSPDVNIYYTFKDNVGDAKITEVTLRIKGTPNEAKFLAAGEDILAKLQNPMNKLHFIDPMFGNICLDAADVEIIL